jgi:nicotinate-nucleotide adenylyltransferase
MNLSGKNNEKNLQISAYYGGTFDPLHNGHLSIIKNITESLLIRKVFLVPTGNPYMKRFSPIATPFQRLAMCKIGVTNKSVQIVDYEVNRPNPSYTIDTLDFLKKTQKDSCIKYIVLGSDAFNELHLWKDYIQLVKSYHFIVIKRIGNKLNKNQTKKNKLHIIKKLDDTNSSQIRNAIRIKKPINKYVSKEIEKYITKTNLYQ